MILTLPFKEFWQQLKCGAGYHKLIVGSAWSYNKRFDICPCCGYDIWVEDEIGYKEMKYQGMLWEECTRRVLLEKLTKRQLFMIEEEKHYSNKYEF